MCPICIGGAVAVVSGAISSGGLSAVAWKKLGIQPALRPEAETSGSVTNPKGGRDESANAGK